MVKVTLPEEYCKFRLYFIRSTNIYTEKIVQLESKLNPKTCLGHHCGSPTTWHKRWRRRRRCSGVRLATTLVTTISTVFLPVSPNTICGNGIGIDTIPELELIHIPIPN